jgi:TonB-linked SusC/RagA family outer membrane protein
VWVAIFSLTTVVVSAQTRTVTGVVVDANNNPIPGAIVVIDGTNNSTVSIGDGTFSLAGAPADGNISVSIMGFATQTVPLTAQTTYRITMSEDTQFLDEVVVVGYGQVRKSDVTGAVASVGARELTSRPVTNVMDAMQGRAAGVDITSSSRPGELGEIRVRGVRSLTASNDPLYVVDGVPLTTQRGWSRGGNQTSTVGGIETINPQDIESINVLKDASATAIYGSRGANGVVLITTKRGQEGKLALNYSGTVSFESMRWAGNYMNAEDYIDFYRWAYWGNNQTTYARGDQPTPENDRLVFARDSYALENVMKGWAGSTWDPSKVETTDWIGMVKQSNYTMDHTVSVSGGTQTMRAYASLGYMDNRGTTKGQDYQRYTARANVELTPTKWFRMGLNSTVSLTDQDYGMASIGASFASMGGDLIDEASRLFPFAVPYTPNGERISFPGGDSRNPTIVNEWEYSTNNREATRIQLNVFADVKLFEGLTYQIRFGPDYRNRRQGLYNDGQSVTRMGSSFAQVDYRKEFDWTLDNMLMYNRMFGDHGLDVTLLQTASRYNYERASFSAIGVPVSSMKWYAITQGNNPTLNSWETDFSEKKLMSYMGRINYSFRDRYLLTLSGRWDGASVLSAGHKWAFFPSAALAWRMEEEEFIKSTPWIQQLKLRLGYGVTGNAAIDPYATKGDINSMFYPFGGSLEQGYIPFDRYAGATNRLVNPNLGWEKTSQINVGVDYSLFRGRLSGSIDVYKSWTSDLLMQMNVVSLVGYENIMANIGKTENSGVDVQISSVNIATKDFTWSTTLAGAYQKEKITELANGKEDMIGDGWFIGQPIRVYYDYEGEGIWQDTPEDQAEMALFNANGHVFRPGLTRPKDQNGDHRITANEDRVIIGQREPRFTFGLTNNFSYKNLDLSIFLNARMGYLISTGQSLTAMYGDQRQLDYWTPVNTDAEYQSPIQNEGGGDPYFAAGHHKDNSYIAIRNISLGYRLPANFISKLGLVNARVYAQVQNPGMLWANIKFHNADMRNQLWWNQSFVFGLNLGF